MTASRPHRFTSPEKTAAALFRAHGWTVESEPQGSTGLRADLLIRKGSLKYAVEIKWVSEGRPDRVIAALSTAILQARRYAADLKTEPLAIVQVSHATDLLLKKMTAFQQAFAPETAVGLVADGGTRHFLGRGLEELNHAPEQSTSRRQLAPSSRTADLFSDLNQWMLKVLLAPEVPTQLLNAPRGEYRTLSALADAAKVSTMSASRFARQLKANGFLDDSGASLRLVRRGELFRRWQAAALRTSPEVRMRYLIPAPGTRQMGEFVRRLKGCVGLFAAADLLKVGHVSGVVPHIFIGRLTDLASTGVRGLLPSQPGEKVDLILKQATTPQSIYRGAVLVDDMPVSDVLQIWLDASAHPSRGKEQADYLERTVLKDILGVSL